MMVKVENLEDAERITYFLGYDFRDWGAVMKLVRK